MLHINRARSRVCLNVFQCRTAVLSRLRFPCPRSLHETAPHPREAKGGVERAPASSGAGRVMRWSRLWSDKKCLTKIVVGWTPSSVCDSFFTTSLVLLCHTRCVSAVATRNWKPKVDQDGRGRPSHDVTLRSITGLSPATAHRRSWHRPLFRARRRWGRWSDQ